MVDTAIIKIKAGNGGDGHVSFRREKFIAKGGPDGGDGGKGGSVYFVADENLNTLLDFHSRPRYEGEPGVVGGKKKMAGANGEDLLIRVPVGTLVYEERSKEIRDDSAEISRSTEDLLVCDLLTHGEKFLIARGGRGGKGNVHFKSSTNQVPMQYTPGVLGEEKIIRLEVKIVADVGLIGMPNAGKSTLLNHLTNSNAKVANYPFTTLSPNLGAYTLKNGNTIVLADIPGLIEGASEGKGLGDDFLRHVERTRILVHMIDGFNTDPVDSYEVIRKELVNYGKGLENKPEIIVVNKIDITEVKDSFDIIVDAFKDKNIKVFGISAATGEGIEDLMIEVMKVLEVNPKVVEFEVKTPTRAYTIANLPNKKIVFKEREVLEKETTYKTFD